jgi:hypothetical protein
VAVAILCIVRCQHPRLGTARSQLCICAHTHTYTHTYRSTSSATDNPKYCQTSPIPLDTVALVEKHSHTDVVFSLNL